MIGQILNQNLTTFDFIMNLLNIVMATRAAYWNFKAAQSALFTIRFAVGVLAVIYCVSYLVLTFTQVNPGEWSSVMRGLGPLAYHYVWTKGPKASWEAQHTLADKFEEAVAQRMQLGKKDGNEE